MALNGNFVSLYSIIERVYRDAGYQQVDWTEAVEWVADCLRHIGASDAFKLVSTNGLGDNPAPIEIVDYKASLPIGFINYKAARKIEIATDGTISDFYPMLYTTDLFSQTPIKRVLEDVEASTYDWFEYIDDNGDLVQQPVIVKGMRTLSYEDYAYTYRMNDSSIETSFETGYVELTYLSYVTDEHGFPMIPDNISFIDAVKSFVIERLDYKAWRKGAIADKVWIQSKKDRDWYIAQADSKASIPSISRMESLKNQLLRTNPKIDYHDVGFKYNNIQERRRI